MKCPKCGLAYSKIIDSRETDIGRKRRRECLGCQFRYNVYEVSEKEYEEIKKIAKICFDFAETIKREVFFLGSDCIKSNPR